MSIRNSYLNYMYWVIPTLAFSIATLSGFGATSMMGSIAGSANAGIGQAATGSMSMGNIYDKIY